MRKLLAVLFVFVLVLGIAEWGAARFAESRIEDKVGEEVTANVEAEVDSFPLVTRLLALEEIGRIRVTLTGADYEQIDFDTLTVEASGLEIPRQRLFDGKVRPTSIESGSVNAFISRTSLGEATGTPVPSIDLGSLSASLDDGTLSLETGGAPPVSVEVPVEALPCSTTGEVTTDGVRLRCEVDRLPDIVLEQIPR